MQLKVNNYQYSPDYGFVSELKPNSNPKLLRTPYVGTHEFCIIQESMVDIYYKYRQFPLLENSTKLVKQNQDRGFMCTFWDLLPQQIQNFSDQVFVRSESLILRIIGNGSLIFEKNINDTNKITNKHLNDLRAIFKSYPQKIVYRLLDYCHEEFWFLESNLPAEYRGSQRLINEPYLIERELEVIKLLLELNKDVTVLIPYCINMSHYDEIYKILDAKFSDRISIGLSAENLYSLENLAKFKGAKAIFFAPSDITADLFKGSRSTIDVTQKKKEVVEYIVDVIDNTKFNSNNHLPIILNCKILVGKFDKFREKGFKIIDLYTPDQVVIPLEERERIEDRYCRRNYKL